MKNKKRQTYICIKGFEIVGVSERYIDKLKRLYHPICAPISEEELEKLEIKKIKI